MVTSVPPDACSNVITIVISPKKAGLVVSKLTVWTILRAGTSSTKRTLTLSSRSDAIAFCRGERCQPGEAAGLVANLVGVQEVGVRIQPPPLCELRVVLPRGRFVLLSQQHAAHCKPIVIVSTPSARRVVGVTRARLVHVEVHHPRRLETQATSP